MWIIFDDVAQGNIYMHECISLENLQVILPNFTPFFAKSLSSETMERYSMVFFYTWSKVDAAMVAQHGQLYIMFQKVCMTIFTSLICRIL